MDVPWSVLRTAALHASVDQREELLRDLLDSLGAKMACILEGPRPTLPNPRASYSHTFESGWTVTLDGVFAKEESEPPRLLVHELFPVEELGGS